MENQLKKPWYLTTILVVTIVHYVFNTLILIFFPKGFAGYELQIWYSIVSIITEIVVIIGLLAIFRWKKSGFYIATAVSLLSIVADYIAQPDWIVGTSILTLLPCILIYFCMRPVWSSFK